MQRKLPAHDFCKNFRSLWVKDGKMKNSGKISQIENRCVLLRFYKNWNKSYTQLLISTTAMNFWFPLLCYIWKGSICLLLFQTLLITFFLSSVVYPRWIWSIIVELFPISEPTKLLMFELFYVTIKNWFNVGIRIFHDYFSIS